MPLLHARAPAGRWSLAFLATAALAASAHAAEPAPAASQAAADVVWIAAAGSLVFFMQAGFALLESGMSRAKNAINVIMKNYCDMCFGAIAFWAVGYGLMFGSNATGWFGADRFFPGAMPSIDYAWLFFQTMFAATAATIVSGAIAERARFGAYITASMLVTGIVYPVFGAWAWGSLYDGQGWLRQMGFIDFAGSTVVHSVGAWCALAALIVIGPRTGRYGADGKARTIPGHNLTSVALGGFILWLGWFGFNGGSTVARDGRHRPHPRQHALRRRSRRDRGDRRPARVGTTDAAHRHGERKHRRAGRDHRRLRGDGPALRPPHRLRRRRRHGRGERAPRSAPHRRRRRRGRGARFRRRLGNLAAGLFKAGALFDLGAGQDPGDRDRGRVPLGVPGVARDLVADRQGVARCGPRPATSSAASTTASITRSVIRNSSATR